MKVYYAAAIGATLLAGTALGFTRRSAPAIIRRSSTMAFNSPAEFAKSEIASSDVVVFSKTFCPFCTSTKQLFSSMNIDAKVIELDQMDNGAEVQGALLDISGQRTVPNVFIKGEHLGGNDDTQGAARSGKLEKMLGK
mmetsp:Transcript_5940/g.10837  ORF Transcript_5940/g.10837 Transcript_5940/m.10837 type:complete len:138 (-) Transcript_5940:124-537(-)|eukprot:CAMPEP_0201608570 /NCGR_PEP_ID=MMETSP0492-20130828/7887_1 /ASSEMBLY_ACC=CAM_ASM_000837 /TAXON_ID=420259 /ORGANISM="Thalassiosira gravida, Strain GMp14c1" /LENGTH=137 /DNA_ID=CAMNT_0048073413 /DNA_START=113 /DNA_END=526 /DNA_ORIENTATION=+